MLKVRQAGLPDAARLLEIYNHYVLNTSITFETTAVSLDEMQNRLRERLSGFNFLVGEADGRLIGYTYYSTFRVRAAYHQTVESTIILDKDCRGQGYGTQLYRALLGSAANQGFHEMIAVIALPNPESLYLHRKMGFREAGVLHNVGYKFGRYLDTAYWQKSLVQV
jgi:L-amino acid N-acyltransferase YncA